MLILAVLGGCWYVSCVVGYGIGFGPKGTFGYNALMDEEDAAVYTEVVEGIVNK